MPLSAPNLDNRRYADILAEARMLIPRYTPEWTDFNDNDPGMALVQLQAWMTEMLIFRMNQVPELNYIKFLQLLGIELRPAEPARAEIAFPLAEGQGAQTIIVPAGTQVAAAGAVGDEPLIFETDESLIALAPQIKRVLVFDGYSAEDFTPQNDAGAVADPFLPFGALASEGSALLLGFAYPDKFPGKQEFPKTQVNLAFSVHIDGVRPEITSCGLTESQVFPSARLVWEYWNKTEWLPLSLDKDTTFGLMRSGHILLSTPRPGAMQKDRMDGAPEDLFWMRLRVATAGYERPPLLDAVRTNTVAATQARTQRDEVVGGSSGAPDQVFQLALTPVLSGTLRIEVDEGEGFLPWIQVADFFASTGDDKHYALNRTTGEVRFGNGEHGRIPVGNVDNPDGNIIARIYRYGGGKQGSVGAGMLTSLLSGPAGVDANAVTNLFPATGGKDEETLAEGKLRAPQVIKNQCRAVTAEDFQTLAEQAPGVRRAKALPLAHPGFPGVEVPGAVSVIIVPESDTPNPTPSQGIIRTVCAYLDQRRLLTTELYVVSPVYHLVRVSARIIATGNSDLAEVKRAVEARLLDYFHPLNGGEDGLGWEFGGGIYFSLIYRHVLDVSGVRLIRELLIDVDGEEQLPCTDFPIEAGALVYSVEHELVVTYDNGG